MKKIIFSSLLTLAATFVAMAQEHAIFSQYTQFPVLVNPGYTGFDDDHQLLLKMRSNWAGFPGAPKSYAVQYNGGVTDKLGLGAGLFTENIGSQTFNKFNINYAFRFKMKSTKIGIGLSTDFINSSIESSLLVNPLVDGSDQALENAVTGQRIFSATAGIYGTYADRFMFGLSFPSAIRTRLDDAPVVEGADDENGGLGKYYILQLGYTLDVPGQNFKLVPSMSLRKIREVPYQIDFNLRGLFFDDKLVAVLPTALKIKALCLSK